MKISAKARYGLAAIIKMAKKQQSTDEFITLISLAEELQISKIYLEQVFSQLKRAEIVTSTKGSRGGYSLSRPTGEITVFDLLASLETSIFEKTEKTVEESQPSIEKCMEENIFEVLDESIEAALSSITIEELANKLVKYGDNENYMYYV